MKLETPNLNEHKRVRWWVVHLEGTSNFRDIGGYQARDGLMVRWGQLYRSASIDAQIMDGAVAALKNHQQLTATQASDFMRNIYKDFVLT